MVIVYHAANSLDANMIRSLLEQYGIRAYIQGEYLQGGVGELPTTGLVTVSVDNTQQTDARKIITEWETGSILDEYSKTNHEGGVLNATP